MRKYSGLMKGDASGGEDRIGEVGRSGDDGRNGRWQVGQSEMEWFGLAPLKTSCWVRGSRTTRASSWRLQFVSQKRKRNKTRRADCSSSLCGNVKEGLTVQSLDYPLMSRERAT
jgi:hypothetical protein